MKHYSYDQSGKYRGESNSRVDPLESKKAGSTVYMLPGFATFIVPPIVTTGKEVLFEGGDWVLKDIVVPPPKPEETTTEKKNRLSQDLRNERNNRLNLIDKNEIPADLWDGMTSTKKGKYKTLKQKLRDLPSSHTTLASLENPTWPTL